MEIKELTSKQEKYIKIEALLEKELKELKELKTIEQEWGGDLKIIYDIESLILSIRVRITIIKFEIGRIKKQGEQYE